MTDSERYDLMLDEIDILKRENKDLQAEITALQDKIERGELVEVVRCINCKYLDVSDCGEGTIYCNNHKTYFYDDFSCPCGGRSVE